MSSFTTRVELYGEPPKDAYTRLHEAMYRNGFKRRLDDEGKVFEVPHAEYLSSQKLSTKQVVELAKETAAPIWKDFCVLVTETSSRWEYYNLRPGK